MALAARERDGETTAVISDEAVFGEIGSDPRFVAAFTEALEALRTNGARSVMKRLVEEK